MVGLPGSGKTTLAKDWARGAPNRIVTVSRDDIRQTIFNQYGIVKDREDLISKIEEFQVSQLLNAGLLVVVHDMNLRAKYRKRWYEIAEKARATFSLEDLTGVPLETCIERNELRHIDKGRVPHEVITSNYEKFVRGKEIDEDKEFIPRPSIIPYFPDYSKPRAFIVDVDGTVAEGSTVRTPYDTSRYHLDLPKQDVIDLVQRLHYDSGMRPLFTTGRHEDFRGVTYEWLVTNMKMPVDYLFMRENRQTPDDQEKIMLFDKHIRDNFWVNFCLDDRDRVVRAWRSLGLTCLQVAEGDF
jgi:predicted kinase/uncharacterized HAD superfamily protein